MLLTFPEQISIAISSCSRRPVMQLAGISLIFCTSVTPLLCVTRWSSSKNRTYWKPINLHMEVMPKIFMDFCWLMNTKEPFLQLLTLQAQRLWKLGALVLAFDMVLVIVLKTGRGGTTQHPSQVPGLKVYCF